jgi:citrate/tricarballylate utilization protein
VPPTDPVREAERLMTICNACRYCEGHCAVFPAMELRLTFVERDLRYLADLCHGCGSCYHHCQYAPPHPFAVDVPAAFAALRLQGHRRYAWPRALGVLFEKSALATLLVSAGCVGALLTLSLAAAGPAALRMRHGPGRFYDILPHGLMVAVFGLAALHVTAAFGVAFVRSWRDAGAGPIRRRDAARALRDALGLRYLDGGGEGCTYPGERPSKARRVFHHLTFYGFALCFASTCSGTVYHSLGLIAPYDFWSVPVVLGSLGGAGLVVGPLGLLALKARADPAARVRAAAALDVSFSALLLLVTLSGFALLSLRATAAMGLLLVVHLGLVLALFLTMPYGKFVHALHHFSALLRNAMERPHLPPHGVQPGGLKETIR